MKYLIPFILLLSACNETTQNPDGSVIYKQDVEQCTAQPDLAWCKAACETESHRWCYETRAHQILGLKSKD